MDAPSLIREPCRTRNCAEESSESFGRSIDKGPMALLDRHDDAVAARNLSGLRPPYPAPAAPAVLAPSERDFGNRDGAHEPF